MCHYFAPGGVRSIAMNAYVCLSVCLSVGYASISQKTACPYVTKFSVHFIRGRDSGHTLTTVEYVMYFRFCK